MDKAAENQKKRKHFRVLHIVIAVFVLIFIAVCVFAYVNRENLLIAYRAYSTSPEELLEQQEKNNQRIDNALNSLTDVQMHELTEEEREMLDNGEITEEEAINIVTGRVAEKEASIARKDALIAQVYVLRASYTSKIEGLIASAKSAYLALPSSERNLSAKVAAANSLISQGNALEAECDAQMNALLDSLAAELNKLGEDTGIISEIRSIYVEEKRIKKASLMGVYYSN